MKQWPALSRVYGLHPWDTDRMTPDELVGYLADLDTLRRRADG